MGVNLGTAIGYLDLDTSKFKRGFQQANNDLKTFSDKTATTDQKLSGLSSAMSSMGSKLTKSVTLPIVGIGTAMVKTTADFEAGMSQVGAISGATGEDLKALEEKAKQMGATTKFSATESTEALKYMAMAGWDTQKMLDGLSGVMNLAAASGEDLATTSDIVTDAMTAFGLEASQATHFADILAQASSKSNTNVAMMGETFKYVAPIAGSLGYSAEDTAVAIGLMANAGIKASQAGTSLRGALTRMAAPTGEVASMMKKLGIEVVNSDGSMKPLKETMDILREKMSGLSESEKAAAANTIFGKNAMSGMLAIINASEQDYAKLTEQIYNCDGASQQMADTMNDNLSGQLVLLKSAIEGIAIAFGEVMLPYVKAIVSAIQNFANWVNGLSDGAKKLVVLIATVAAAIGPALLIASKLITTFLTIKTLLSTTGLALSALTGPVAIVIGVVAALAVAIATNFGGIRDFIVGVMKVIGTIISTAVTNIKTVWDTNFLNIRNTVITALRVVSTVIRTVLQVILGLFRVFAGVLNGDWQQVWEGVKTIAQGVWNGIKSAFKLFLGWIINTLRGIGGALLGAAKEVFQKAKQGFTSKWNEIKTWFSKVVKHMPIIIQNIGHVLKRAASNAFSNLWSGFKEKWKSIKSWFEGVANWIKNKLSSLNSAAQKAQAIKSGAGGGGGRAVPTPKGYAKGLPYVPYDGFPAILHKGERVLTADEATAYNRGQSGGQYAFNFYSPQELSPAEQARRFKKTMNEILFTM